MLKGREALEGLQSPGEVIGDEIDEVLSKLIAAVAVEALDCGVLDRPVPALDLAVRARASGFRQPMLDVEAGAGVFKGVSPKNAVSARRALISPGVRAAPSGSVKCVPLSVRTV